MTAIVAVLNKHGVAVAADSAVTMGDTHKVVNSANKIFTLSKYHPVAVMTYSNASFMGVPWDIIIKEYRKQLGDKSYPLLKDYVEDFIKFIHARNFFCPEKTERAYVRLLLDSFYQSCFEELSKELGISKDAVSQDQLEEKLKRCMETNMKGTKCPEFETWTFEDFSKYADPIISAFSKEKGFHNDSLLSESFFYYLSAAIPTAINTGLVFVGYGESAIFPSLLAMNVSIGIDGHLKYFYNGEETKIGDNPGEYQAVICPFAQIDVTQTIIRGINPSFLDIIKNVIGQSMNSVTGAVARILDSNPETTGLSSAVKGLDLDSMIRVATSQIEKEMLKRYTNPLITTVQALDKEDMANMAESFISITSLVRHMQPGEETVGGPVDVAIISKGDGFVWINRKHYFKPEFNAPFFSNYFNH